MRGIDKRAAGLAAAGILGMVTGLWGVAWGLPGPRRLRLFPDGRPPSLGFAQQLADGWARLYEGIRQAHREMRSEEPVAYAKGIVEIPSGWTFPPDSLLNSYRSFLIQSENPEEKKCFIILSQMRPWKLEFKPLYVQYGGSFIYALGAFLKGLSWLGAVRLIPDLRHYLRHPEDMGRLFLCGRLFIVLFFLASLWILYDMGCRLSGPGAGALAAAFFALCPVIAVNFHMLKPHPFAAFWCLAAARGALKALEAGTRREYLLAGLCAGLAAGANFFCVPFGAVGLLAYLERRRQTLAGPGELRLALWGAAAAAAVWALTNPYLIFAYRDFAWELEIYPPRVGGWGLERLVGLLGAAPAHAMGALLYGTAVAALGTALFGRRGPQRLLAGVLVLGLAGVCLLLGRYAFAGTPGTLRFFLPMVGLGCLLAADGLVRLPVPAAAKAAAMALILADTGLRGYVYLENMRIGSGAFSTMMRAAAAIEERVPAGSRVGLERYPEPAHTPPFRYDRYHLVVIPRPEELEASREPDYLVLAGSPAGAARRWAGGRYAALEVFEPFRAGWATVQDENFFANRELAVYKRL